MQWQSRGQRFDSAYLRHLALESTIQKKLQIERFDAFLYFFAKICICQTKTILNLKKWNLVGMLLMQAFV